MNKTHKILLLNIEQGKLGKQCCCLVYRIVVSIGFVFLPLLLKKNFSQPCGVSCLARRFLIIKITKYIKRATKKMQRNSPIHVYFDYIYAVWAFMTHTDSG